MVNKIQGIDYETALANLRASSLELRGDLPEKNELLSQFHPDYQANARVKLPIGPNQGDYCHPDLAKLLISHPLIDDYDLSGAEHLNTDVLVIGGGGAGAAAALSATEAGARVIMANKLRIGDSNTVMAEGGIQAAVGAEDSLQQHFDDTIKGGHNVGKKELVAQMVTDAPSAIRWLIGLGMTFDLAKGADSNGMLSRKRAGGTTVPRILSYRDFTGLEMMRVLREAVELDENITQLNRHPAIELLSDEHGRCVGAILYDLEKRSLVLVHAKAVVLATGGSGRLHLQGFATSNHYGATADGLVMAYRIGAKLRDVDSFQYHPTGVAHPPHLAGALISEAVRSAGTKLVNGLGERFVDELQPRDVVAAAILRECREGRGVVRDGQVGVFLDTPRLIENDPDVLNRLVTLGHVAHKCGIDPAVEPVMIHPTLHYQNGGVEINGDGATADGLVMAYRIGAKLRDIDSFQYHPTGVAHPPHFAGALISEAVRSAGTKLVNGLGERFVDELQPRDVVAAAILRECREGRGVVRDGQVGVFLDTPRLIANDPDVLNRLVTLGHVAHKCGIDPAVEPVMIHPTLHYQNGGIEINGNGATCVEGLYCAGEVTGGIHGRNRLMGNALLDIISFGRRAGKAAANCGLPLKKVRGGVGHVHDLQREMTRAGLTSDIKAPVLYPDYGKFDLREHAGLQEQQS